MRSWKAAVTIVLFLGVGILMSPGAVVFADDSVTLRINDARTEPGGLVAVVVRTYAPRGMEQGEICLTTSSAAANSLLFQPGLTKKAWTKTAAAPFVALEAVDVPSTAGDATSVAAFDELDQTALVRFSSPSGTVNETDTPVAVFYFRVSSAIVSEAEFQMELDLGATYLIDADGETLEIEPVGGRLEVRPTGETLRLEALDERVAPGETAHLGIETREPLAIAGGQVALTYDPAFAAGVPTVTMDPQYGLATFTVDTSTAGLVLVSFVSPDGSLNSDSDGELITVHLPTSTDLPDGSKSPVVLDPASTYLVDPQGRWIGLELRDAELEIDD